MKKILYHFSRFFVGWVFVFSGFVKAVDPMGTAIKFSDYFNYAFNLSGLTPLSLPLSLIMCAVELSVGILLVLNLLPKISTWTSVLLMLVFTPLTFYLAVANPVSDCGCFGDAITLSNWQTFWKNIVIDFFIVFLVLWNKDFPAKLDLKIRQISSTVLVLLVFGFELYNYSYLPIIDFRPYKVGNNIPEMMTIPEDAEQDIYETTFIYKNSDTKEEKEFTQENYPWDDSTWVWVETKSKLIKQGFVPPIHNFELVDLDGNDNTDYILSKPDTTILVVTYTLEEMNSKNIIKVRTFVDSFKLARPNTEVFCLTSSDNDAISNLVNDYDLFSWTFCKIDEVTSKTIIRSNPGLVLLKEGTIIDKIHYHSLTDKRLKHLLEN
ncbi:MAG: DoxX family protein [Bacteroidales bacterium]|nr:DoxX family protein [Bacteroidales bacterium]